jgi:hypothetical protein
MMMSPQEIDALLEGRPSPQERLLTARYRVRLHALHRRLYRRLRLMSSLVGLIAAATALAGLPHEDPLVLGITGLVIAAVSVSDLVFGWSERAARHEIHRQRIAWVLATDPDHAMLEHELAQSECRSREEIQALRLPVRVDVLRAHGISTEAHVTWFERLVYRVAA